MKIYIIITIFSCILLQCTGSHQKSKDDITEVSINYGNIKSYKSGDIITDYSFIALDSLETSMFGEISQIEIKNDLIYILDTRTTRGLYIFRLDGKFVNKIEGVGNGPGEFMMPHSFCLDHDSILIYDRLQSRLLQYQLPDLKFIKEIVLPIPYPLSVFKVPDMNLYAYYATPSSVKEKGNKQLIIADENGNIKKQLWDAPITSKVLHGSSCNFYTLDNTLNFYPYFSNKIFTLKNDSLICKYTLNFGNNKLAQNSLFEKFNDSGEIMKELLTGKEDWIRLLYIYENPDFLIVKYYIKKDFYIGVYSKKNKENPKHFKCSEVEDNLKIGHSFPLPVGIYNDKLIGILNRYDIDDDLVEDPLLKDILKKKLSKESNPILIIYGLKN